MPYRSHPDRLLARFWAKVEKSDGCWLWRGARTGKGYGNVKRNGRWYGAHKYAYELEHGPVPDGMELCHHCDTPACVRPSHLFVGTHIDNVRDMMAKGRHSHGERTPAAKLSEADVLDIRRLYATREMRSGEIAARYGVHYQHVWMIVTGRLWAHLPTAERRPGRPRGGAAAPLAPDAATAIAALTPERLAVLETRDAAVLSRYFGIGRARRQPLNEIAAVLDMSRANVSRRKDAALRRIDLRHLTNGRAA